VIYKEGIRYRAGRLTEVNRWWRWHCVECH